jgi:hypothetical protein
MAKLSEMFLVEIILITPSIESGDDVCFSKDKESDLFRTIDSGHLSLMPPICSLFAATSS